MTDNIPQAPHGEFVLFTSADGQTRVECRFESDTLWLSQAAMAELYDKDCTINEHLINIYNEGELCIKRNHPEIPDSSIGRYSPSISQDRPLQSRCHSVCWLQSSFATWNTVPPMGNENPERIPDQGICHG